MERIFVIDQDELRQFQNDVLTYWETRGRAAFVNKELQQNFPDVWKFLQDSQVFIPTFGGPLAHTIQDYVTFLRKGLIAIKADIQAEIDAINVSDPHNLEVIDRINQYKAMMIAADGMMIYASRNADYAEELASREEDPDRAAELLEMARICRKVPAHPAENWWEALQSLHFLRAATSLTEGMDSHSVGRFDQYMLPWLQNDIDAGSISMKKAQELLECLFLKWNESTALQWGLGSPRGNNDKINLGGVDEDGNDATNVVSYMLLEAHAHVHLIDPALSVRVNNNTPDEFLSCALEVLRLGGGLPLLINDKVIVPGMIGKGGVSVQDARNYGDVGCQENVTDPNMTGADTSGRQNGGFFNLVKPIELAIWNGVNPLNGKQIGPKTGNPRDFKTMDEFMKAVEIQMKHAVDMYTCGNNVWDYVLATYYPSVFHNLMHPGPRKTGIDFLAGGAKYNWTGGLGVGLGTAGDSLTAVDTVVYKNKSASWDELLNALKISWEGQESLRKSCINAPKYGCDDKYADGWTKTILDMWFHELEKHSTGHGGHFVGGLIIMDSYIALGQMTAATPDGRMSQENLSDSVAPSRYAPVSGATAVHSSVARAIDTYHTTNGVIFNQRFSVSSVSTKRDVSKWADLVRTYMDAGGQQIQYMIVDHEELKDAQKNPDQYRDLLVRIGGYSAIFVDLTKELQDSIMARAELMV